MEMGDADLTPIENIGVPKGVAERLMRAEVNTVGQLSAWLRVRFRHPISGIGQEAVGKLADLLVTHQLRKRPEK